MGDLLKTFLDFVERFPTLAWRMGLSCAGLGAAVYGAIWMGFVRPEAFNGYAEDGARLAIALGAGFFIIGVIFAVARTAVRIFTWAGRRRQRHAHAQVLQQNMRFLTTPAQLILYVGMTEPGGRFPSFGEINAMRLLSQYKLVVPEGYYSLSIGHMVRVAPEIYALRDEIMVPLKKQIEDAMGVSVDDVEAVKSKLEAMLKRESTGWEV